MEYLIGIFVMLMTAGVCALFRIRQLRMRKFEPKRGMEVTESVRKFGEQIGD